MKFILLENQTVVCTPASKATINGRNMVSRNVTFSVSPNTVINPQFQHLLQSSIGEYDGMKWFWEIQISVDISEHLEPSGAYFPSTHASTPGYIRIGDAWRCGVLETLSKHCKVELKLRMHLYTLNTGQIKLCEVTKKYNADNLTSGTVGTEIPISFQNTDGILDIWKRRNRELNIAVYLTATVSGDVVHQSRMRLFLFQRNDRNKLVLVNRKPVQFTDPTADVVNGEMMHVRNASIRISQDARNYYQLCKILRLSAADARGMNWFWDMQIGVGIPQSSSSLFLPGTLQGAGCVSIRDAYRFGLLETLCRKSGYQAKLSITLDQVTCGGQEVFSFNESFEGSVPQREPNGHSGVKIAVVLKNKYKYFDEWMTNHTPITGNLTVTIVVPDIPGGEVNAYDPCYTDMPLETLNIADNASNIGHRKKPTLPENGTVKVGKRIPKKAEASAGVTKNPLAAKLPLKIITVDGITYAIQASTDWTVKRLKDQFLESAGQKNDQSLVLEYRGNVLNNDNSYLSDFKFAPDSVIQSNVAGAKAPTRVIPAHNEVKDDVAVEEKDACQLVGNCVVVQNGTKKANVDGITRGCLVVARTDGNNLTLGEVGKTCRINGYGDTVYVGVKFRKQLVLGSSGIKIEHVSYGEGYCDDCEGRKFLFIPKSHIGTSYTNLFEVQ